MRKILIFNILFIALLVKTYTLEVSDGKIKLILHENIGRFSLYYLSDQDNNKYTPLFTDQDPRTTTFSIVVNNKVYRLGDSITFKETSEKTTNGAKFTWKSNQLEIIQEFSFMKSVTSTVTDGVKMSFNLANISDSELEVGARFIIDTNLGESSSTHYKTNSGLKITKETKIESADMIDYWVSMKEESIGLMAITKGTGITTPDIIIFANWKRLNDTSWSYSTSSSRNFNLPPYSINDSAVCHYYFPQKINRGSSIEIVLILGNYSEAGYSIKKNTSSSTSSTSETSTTNNSNTNNTTDLTSLLNSDAGTDLSNSSLLAISLKGDISTLETVIEDINAKIANGNYSENDIALLEKIIAELKIKAEKYNQNK